MKNLEKQVNDFNKYWFDSKRKNIGMNAFYNFLIEEDNLNRQFANKRNEEILPRLKAPKGNFNQTAEFYKDKNGLLVHNPFYNREFLSKAKDKLQSWIDNDLTNTKVAIDSDLPEGTGYYSGMDENTIHVSNSKDLWVALHESLHRLTDFSKDDKWAGKSRHFADIPSGEDPYWDSTAEKYASLHANRQKWGLDPNTIYTKDSLMKHWKETGIIPSGVFLYGNEKEQNEMINAINNSF